MGTIRWGFLHFYLIFQMELAGKLAEDGHLICGDNLVEVRLKCVMKTSLVELNFVLNL